MAKKDKKEEKKPYFRHRSDAEWLTYDICISYRDKARNIRNRSMSDNDFKGLCRELMDQCDVTEVQAINILNGLYLNEYVAAYEHMKKRDQINKDNKDYLEWLAQKGDSENELDDYSLPDEV